ncbi:phosphoprotein [Moesziomyces antarcticus T-34]|uniref:Autophagy-related protein 13 n=1 Tax=Pseudozyma antarctica (strain T-34) TaxID=1151754 RepID=M9MCC7_PSEA3|nr:phosphoprotein [Moesziomyces antarcticus T-34]
MIWTRGVGPAPSLTRSTTAVYPRWHRSLPHAITTPLDHIDPASGLFRLESDPPSGRFSHLDSARWMPSHYDPSLQRRTSSSSHPSTSPTSATIDAPSQQQQQQQQQQQPQQPRTHHEAQPPLHRQSSSGTSAPLSQSSKLDGVLYHFYTTTANLVIQARLAHLRPFLLTPASDPHDPDNRPPSTPTAPSHPKLSRWFGLHIPDTDVFKDELRLWRSVTSLLAMSTTGTSSAVPDLIIDVMLDLSNVPHTHEVLLLTDTRSAARLCIDGRAPGQPATQLRPASRPQRIVLERWRLRFDPHPPESPPDLSTFYKRSVVHFRALFTLLCILPANRLCARIEALKAAPQQSAKGFPSIAARADQGAYDAQMTIGCRLSMSDMDADSDPADAANSSHEVAATDALPAEQAHLIPDIESEEDQPDIRLESHGHYASRTFAPLATPLGHLTLSVTYRKLTGFSVEDAESLRSANNIKVDVDEDYFKPVAGASPPSARTASTYSGTDRLLAAAPQPVGGISAARPANLAAQRHASETISDTSRSPHAHATEVSPASQSPANVSVFGTSATGRNTAGLSSLRRTGSSSNKASLPLIGSAHPQAAPSSPALAAALGAEPAFVVPSSARRASISERRLRTLSGISSGQPSLSSSPAMATVDLPEPGSSLTRTTSVAQLSGTSSRSVSGRMASDFVAPSAGLSAASAAQSRPGVSFSPSSSSPLAQQMSMHANRATSGASALGTSPSTSSFRSVSGSALRSSVAAAGAHAAPSLRSVFQSYVPRSQNSSSVLVSRTPPTAGSAFVQTSYSPSNLGTGLRSSIRRNSSTSDAGSGSAFGASSSSAAKPQMIKRYSTNFSYRQNRERFGVYGSSLGSEGSGSVGAGGEPSSYPRFGGAGGSLSSAYGRSWVSRMEQRQGLGSGGAFARTSSLDDATAAATASAASRYRPRSSADATHLGNLTPSPRSHDEDMDDLVRLLDTKPAFGTSSMGKLTSLRNERRNAPGLSSTPEEGTSVRPGQALTDSVRSIPGHDRAGSLSGSGIRSGGGIRTANPMSRSQLDDLLSRMAESVGILSAKDQDSGASGEASSEAATSDEVRLRTNASPAAVPATDHMAQAAVRPIAAAVAPATGSVRGYTANEAERHAELPTSRVSGPGRCHWRRSSRVGRSHRRRWRARARLGSARARRAPFAAASRLVGIGGTYGSSVAPAPGGQTDARRGYGVSAPSTQFHYQPTHSAPRPTPNSYPVSRDEMYDDDEEDEEEEDDDGMRRC